MSIKDKSDRLFELRRVPLTARKTRANRVLQQHYQNLLKGGRLVLLSEIPQNPNRTRVADYIYGQPSDGGRSGAG